MKFNQYDFNKSLLKNLEELGFKRPTDIQYKSISPIISGLDTLAIAQTGTGKTAAFVIPIIEKLARNKKNKSFKGIKAIVLSPTRELALQTTKVFNNLEKNTFIKTQCIIGGLDQERQIKRLIEGFDIIVATPGRMFDLHSQGHISFDDVEILVIDEAEQMLKFGFLNDILQLVKQLPKHQTLFFSATINSEIKKLAYSVVNNPIKIQISPKNPIPKNIEHFVVNMQPDDKRFFLERIINENPNNKILCFVRTKVRAERVSNFLERVGIKSQIIHSDKNQQERLDAIENFRAGKNLILIATDISARGIDIANIDIIVNYDLPQNAETYVHRIGRTGRYNQKGIAYSFYSNTELEMLEEIEQYIGFSIQKLNINKLDYFETISSSSEVHTDWKTITKQIEELEKNEQKGKKKKNKK